MRSRTLGVIVSVTMTVGLGVSMATPASATTGKLWYQMGTWDFDQMGAWRYEPPIEGTAAQPADDFVVGHSWKVNEIQIKGQAVAEYGYQPVPPVSENVYIYYDYNRLPSGLLYEFDEVPGTISGQYLTVRPKAFGLTQGTYWLSVLPNFADPHTWFYWARNTSSTLQGYEPVWRGFADPCVGSGQNWTPFIPACSVRPSSGLQFTIIGSGT
jgi:hypothetical protein